MKPQTKLFVIIGTVILLMIISLSFCLFYSCYDQKPTTTKPLKKEAEVINPDTGLDAIDAITKIEQFDSTSVDDFIQEDDTSVLESTELEDGNYFEDQKEDINDGIQSDGHDSIQVENQKRNDSDTTQNVTKLNHNHSAEITILAENYIDTPVNNSNNDQTPLSFNSDLSDGSFIQI